jgi:hypothetical protein
MVGWDAYQWIKACDLAYKTSQKRKGHHRRETISKSLKKLKNKQEKKKFFRRNKSQIWLSR